MADNSDSPLLNTVWLSTSKNGCPVIALHAQPGAKRTAFAGLYGNKLKIALASPPVNGKANAMLLKFLSKTLGIPKSAVTLLNGETSREKRLEIAGLSTDELLAALAKTFSSS